MSIACGGPPMNHHCVFPPGEANRDGDELHAERPGLAARERRFQDPAAEPAAANVELEAFALHVAHDLRAPLRAIDGFSEILARRFGNELAPEAAGYLQRIRANAGQMGSLIEDLLAFSRFGRCTPDVRPVDTRALIRSCLESLQGMHAARCVNVELRDVPDCLADPALLRQVWMNLLDNAFKFTSRRSEARIEIGGRSDGIEHAFYVRDNGDGFDMSDVDELFKVFHRLHAASEFPGSGVGLAIVKRILRHHGGRVWAEAVKGEGATFHFTLRGPAAHAA